MTMNEIMFDIVRRAIEKGGQHILISPEGGVSIWTDVTCCQDCKKWVDMAFEDGTIKACELTEMATKPCDYCSYAETINDGT